MCANGCRKEEEEYYLTGAIREDPTEDRTLRCPSKTGGGVPSVGGCWWFSVQEQDSEFREGENSENSGSPECRVSAGRSRR